MTIYKKIELYNSYSEHKVFIYFDEEFQKTYYPPNGSTCKAIEEAVDCMEGHHFRYADIVDSITGEVLAIVNVCREKDPDDE